MTRRELALAWAALAILAALIFAPHVRHGGLYLDDWADIAGTLYPPAGPGFGHAMDFFNHLLSSCRPVLILFFPLKYTLLGENGGYILTLAVILAITASGLGYGVLRILGLPWYHAWAITALALAYPWFDSTRLWDSATPISLAVIFVLAGVWIALIGLARDSWRLHACAALLYLLSMLTYEITLPFVAAMGLLYTLRVGWKRAWPRWGVDLVMVAAAGLWSRTHTPRTFSTLSGDIKHLGEITNHGGELLGWSTIPLGAQPRTTLALVALAVVFGAGLLAYLFMPGQRAQPGGWGLLNWLRLGVAGLAVAALGWMTFIPADPYYTPSIYGFTNRVNGFSGFGLILVVYAAFGVAGSLIGRIKPGKAVIPIGVTLILGAMLGASYIHVLERHSRLWDAAYGAEKQAAARIKAAYPRLPHGTTLITSGYPAYLTLGVPIFAVGWDLDGRVKLLYKDNSLHAYPLTSEMALACRPHDAGPIAVEARGEPIQLLPYGTLRLFDITTGKRAAPRNQAQCEREKKNFLPGQLYVQTAY